MGKRGRLCLTWPGQEAISIVALVIVGGTTALQCGTRENDLLQIRTGLRPCLHDSTTTDDVEAWFTHSFLTTYRLNRQYSTSIVCEGVLFLPGTRNKKANDPESEKRHGKTLWDGRRKNKKTFQDAVKGSSFARLNQRSWPSCLCLFSSINGRGCVNVPSCVALIHSKLQMDRNILCRC